MKERVSISTRLSKYFSRVSKSCFYKIQNKSVEIFTILPVMKIVFLRTPLLPAKAERELQNLHFYGQMVLYSDDLFDKVL
jgi:hypothetical protein